MRLSARTWTLSSELQNILRRLKPEKRLKRLRPRDLAELPFARSGLPPAGTAAQRWPRLLYDTTVYVDILQGRFPDEADLMLRASDAWHSTVTEAELVALCGLLNPGHPETRKTIDRMMAVIEKRPAHRTIAPDREVWREAGILTGILARLQNYGHADRRRVLNDALLFSSARKHALTVFTRNIGDFDLLQQLDKSGRVLFYRV